MEELDHASINTSEDDASSYKMGPSETRYFVKLRVANSYFFSGKRETSMRAWRAILKHMGLQDKMSHHQAQDKWEYMKKKYKDLKYPPEGVPVFSDSWPYFLLMDDAMEGRLEGSAPVLNVSASQHGCASSLVTVSLGGHEEGNVAAAMKNRGLEQDRALLEREAAIMERERAMMERERAMMERERAMMERERAMMERDKMMMEREEAMIVRERKENDRTQWWN